MDVNSELERFGKDLAANRELRKELAQIASDDAAIVALANAKGYSFTIDDVKAFQSMTELTDDQLEKIAGGTGKSLRKGGPGDPAGCDSGYNSSRIPTILRKY